MLLPCRGSGLFSGALPLLAVRLVIVLVWQLLPEGLFIMGQVLPGLLKQTVQCRFLQTFQRTKIRTGEGSALKSMQQAYAFLALLRLLGLPFQPDAAPALQFIPGRLNMFRADLTGWQTQQIETLTKLQQGFQIKPGSCIAVEKRRQLAAGKHAGGFFLNIGLNAQLQGAYLLCKQGGKTLTQTLLARRAV